jgi:hypothetical protein
LIYLHQSLSHVLKLGAEIESSRKHMDLIVLAYWRIDFAAHEGASMNLRNLCDRIVSSVLSLGIVGTLLALGTHSVSAQSITATTPFPFCVNHQAYPMGTYRLTLISPWLLSIHNVNGEDEGLFQIHPEAGNREGIASGQVGSTNSLTFRTFPDFRELQAVYEPSSDMTFELIGQGIPRDKLKTHGSLKPINCFTEKSSVRGRNTTGQ